ncbi:MAG TPA: hypothetical protein DIT89_13575, partial [Planctomycetaceae bacterium]|nr:hypothetical protein [Planctomycetaceae bacterium]
LSCWANIVVVLMKSASTAASCAASFGSDFLRAISVSILVKPPALVASKYVSMMSKKRLSHPSLVPTLRMSHSQQVVADVTRCDRFVSSQLSQCSLPNRGTCSTVDANHF